MQNLQTTILHKKKAANLESAKNNRIVHNAFFNLAQGYLILHNCRLCKFIPFIH